MTLLKNKLPDTGSRPFEFDRDTFAFANELLWEYQFDTLTGKMNFHRREPKPTYTLRCFVLVKVARQFLYHARFDPGLPVANPGMYRQRVCHIVSRSPRQRCADRDQIVIPGYSGLREFSAAYGDLLKQECGGAWRSYVLRSHWRMVLPLPRKHQTRTALSLARALAQHESPIIHLVKFPSLTINHGMIVFAVTPTAAGFDFATYDPNQPQAPTILTFHQSTGAFTLPANAYWAGGELKVIEIFRSWWM